MIIGCNCGKSSSNIKFEVIAPDGTSKGTFDSKTQADSIRTSRDRVKPVRRP